MQINKNSKHTSSPIEWSTVVVLGSVSIAPRVGSPVVSRDSCQMGNGSKMGTENVLTYTVGIVWQQEW